MAGGVQRPEAHRTVTARHKIGAGGDKGDRMNDLWYGDGIGDGDLEREIPTSHLEKKFPKCCKYIFDLF